MSVKKCTIFAETKCVCFFFTGRPYTVVIPAAGGGGMEGSVVHPMPEGHVVTVPLQSSDSPVVQWQIHGTSDVSDFLRTMNKERMHLEQELGREEETSVHSLIKEQVGHRYMS